MKIVTNGYKNNIKLFGKELDSKITYTIDNEEIELGGEQLNSVSPHYKADILKSVMKQLDVNSKVDIPLNTVINYQFGVKVAGSYEYINYGNYVVIKSEKQEDTNSYQLTCYDKMIYAMKDYEDMNITYPITIRDYINAIASHLGLTFKNASGEFANYDKEIPGELYLTTNGGSLGYTFRDVLDDLAEVTASVICINEDDDELEIRYPIETNETLDEESLKDVNVKFGKVFGPINTIVLSRSAESDSVYYPEPLPQEPIQIKISDNQIMNGNDRSNYLQDIYEKLNGLTFSICDYLSPGITFLEVYDKYNISVGETTYSCLMLEDEPIITQGLSENIATEEPQYSDTEFKYASSTDKMINEAYLIVKKNEGEIEAVVSSVQSLNERENNNYQDILSRLEGYLSDADFTELQSIVRQLQTDTYTKTEVQQIASGVGVDGVKVEAVITETGTFDIDGLLIEKANAKTKGRFNEIGMKIMDATGSSDEELLFAGYDENLNETIVRTKNIKVTKYLTIGTKSRMEDFEDGTGIFYMG